MFLQTVQKNSHKIVTIFKLMIKKIFIKDCYSSNSLINNFESTDFIILDHCVLPKDTVTEKNLTRLSKSTDKKESDLLTDNFHCSSGNKHIKNTQKCTYMFGRVNLDLIF